MATKRSETLDVVEELSKLELLHPELREFVETEQLGSKEVFMVRHPLYVGMLDNGLGHCAAVNRIYKERKAMVAKALSAKDWYSVVFLYERPYRLNAFAEVAAEANDADYWELLGLVVEDAECLHDGKDVVANLLQANRPQRQAMMDEASQKEFAALPDELIIYRGYDDEAGAEGWAWTLSQETAKRFANQWQSIPDRGKAMVVSGVVKKSVVIAYLNGRQEKTIIVNPVVVKVEAKTAVGGEKEE